MAFIHRALENNAFLKGKQLIFIKNALKNIHCPNNIKIKGKK